jgi:hypothetical protein
LSACACARRGGATQRARAAGRCARRRLLEGEQLVELRLVSVLDQLLERAARALHHQDHVLVVLEGAVERQRERVGRAQLGHRRHFVLQVQRVRDAAVKGGLAPARRRELLVHQLGGELEARVLRVVAQRDDDAVPTAPEDQPFGHRLQRRAVQSLVLARGVRDAGSLAELRRDRALVPV